MTSRKLKMQPGRKPPSDDELRAAIRAAARQWVRQLCERLGLQVPPDDWTPEPKP